jgi:hypothetical protein
MSAPGKAGAIQPMEAGRARLDGPHSHSEPHCEERRAVNLQCPRPEELGLLACERAAAGLQARSGGHEGL